MEAATITATGASATLLALVAADGTAAADHARALLDPAAPLRDLADAVHALCILHGALPGVVDHARDGCTEETWVPWLDQAVARFADERSRLAHLAAALGPQPSTPGQAASESAVGAQRHALAILARSDRTGCALGAAAAFVLDWAAVRRVIDMGCARCAIAPAPRLEPFVAETRALLDALPPDFPPRRAMLFGAQQMLAQHRGLWHLLEARASARSGR